MVTIIGITGHDTGLSGHDAGIGGHDQPEYPDLQGYLVYRWQAEACSLLAERLTSLLPADEKSIEQVTSFEMMALWVAAGYGIGVSAQSRIERAHGWEIAMRPLSDGPYQIGTYLQRPYRKTNPVAERFERRALQIARAGAR